MSDVEFEAPSEQAPKVNKSSEKPKPRSRKQNLSTRKEEDEEDIDAPDPSDFLESNIVEDPHVTIKPEPMDETTFVSVDSSSEVQPTITGTFAIKEEPVDPFATRPVRIAPKPTTTTSVTTFSTVATEADDESTKSGMSAKDYKSYVLSTSTTYIVDNVKIYLKNIQLAMVGSKGYKIHLDCPCCSNVEAHTLIGKHLKVAHGATHISCPGLKCHNRLEIPVHEFKDHLQRHHMTILCNYCHMPHNAVKMQEHVQSDHPEKTLLKSEKASVLGSSSAAKRLKVQTVSKLTGPTEIKKSVTYEVLQNGQLVVVDGIHFFVKNSVVFLDCPMCVEKAMAMTLLPEHLYEHHNLSYVKCPADDDLCGETMPWHKLIKHIVSTHGRIPCEFCSMIIRVNDLHLHLTKVCGVSYYHMSQSNENAMKSNSLGNSTSSSLHYKSWLNKPKSKIKEMLLANRKKNQIKCPTCSQTCQHLGKHIREHHQTQVPCEVCFKLVSLTRLSQHKKSHEKKCPMCSKDVLDLMFHLRDQHDDLDDDDIERIYQEASGKPKNRHLSRVYNNDESCDSSILEEGDEESITVEADVLFDE